MIAYVTNKLTPASGLRLPLLRFEVPQCHMKRLKQLLRAKQPLDKSEASLFGEWLREIDNIHRAENGINDNQNDCVQAQTA